MERETTTDKMEEEVESGVGGDFERCTGGHQRLPVEAELCHV